MGEYDEDNVQQRGKLYSEKQKEIDLMMHFQNRKMEGTLAFNFLKDFSI